MSFSLIFLFIKALVLGIIVSAPVGPVAAMAMSRSLNFGMRLGFVTGLGIAFADALFALVAALGVSQVIDFVSNHQGPFQHIGGLVLVVMGTHLYTSAKKVALQKKAKRVKTRIAMLSSFMIGISNPLAIFTFLAAMADPRIGPIENAGHVATITLGVFAGACLWWLFLAWSVTRFKDKIQGRTLMWVNRTLGVFILLIGVFMIFSRKLSL